MIIDFEIILFETQKEYTMLNIGNLITKEDKIMDRWKQHF